MAALLARVAAAEHDRQAAARQVPLGYLAAVLRACAGLPSGLPGRPDRGRGPDRAADHPGDAGAGADRGRRANERIAADLVVTLDTVKKHVTHVLGKLGAANRTEAAARARQLGLVT